MSRTARRTLRSAVAPVVLLAAPRLTLGQFPARAPRPLAADDSVAVVAAERTILDAFVNKDTAAVNRPVADGQIYAQPDGVARYNPKGGPASVLACATGPYVMDHVLLRPVGRDGAVLAYRYLGKSSCGGHAYPDTSYGMADYERIGRAWKRVAIAAIFPARVAF